MNKRLTILILSTILLTGCANSAVNSINTDNNNIEIIKEYNASNTIDDYINNLKAGKFDEANTLLNITNTNEEESSKFDNDFIKEYFTDFSYKIKDTTTIDENNCDVLISVKKKDLNEVMALVLQEMFTSDTQLSQNEIFLNKLKESKKIQEKEYTVRLIKVDNVWKITDTKFLYDTDEFQNEISNR